MHCEETSNGKTNNKNFEWMAVVERMSIDHVGGMCGCGQPTQCLELCAHLDLSQRFELFDWGRDFCRGRYRSIPHILLYGCDNFLICFLALAQKIKTPIRVAGWGLSCCSSVKYRKGRILHISISYASASMPLHLFHYCTWTIIHQFPVEQTHRFEYFRRGSL